MVAQFSLQDSDSDEGHKQRSISIIDEGRALSYQSLTRTKRDKDGWEWHSQRLENRWKPSWQHWGKSTRGWSPGKNIEIKMQSFIFPTSVYPPPLEDSNASLSGGSDRSWAVRPTDCSAAITWSNSTAEQTKSTKLIKVSAGTEGTIKAAFGHSLSNGERLVRKDYPFPDLDASRFPKLDPVIKQNLPKEVKDNDSTSAIVQTRVIMSRICDKGKKF
jgi:hypothetical protein